MFKNKLWLLIVASLVSTSAMTAGPAHAEVCVENDAGLTEQQLSVASLPLKMPASKILSIGTVSPMVKNIAKAQTAHHSILLFKFAR